MLLFARNVSSSLVTHLTRSQKVAGSHPAGGAVFFGKNRCYWWRYLWYEIVNISSSFALSMALHFALISMKSSFKLWTLLVLVR